MAGITENTERPQKAQRASLYDLTLPELMAWVAGQGAPAYRARQLFRDLYQRGMATVEAMTTLPKPFRQAVAEQFALATVESLEVQQSADGTVKWLSRLSDGQLIETVLIPAPRRKTVCVSTQVGCAYACAFCASGQAGFRRHLTAGEIVQQVLLVQHTLRMQGLLPPLRGDDPSPAALSGPSGALGAKGSRSLPLDKLGDRARSRCALPAWGVPTRGPRSASHAGRGWPELGMRQRVTHVVFMGMGEPLANYDHTLKAIRILNAPEGLHLGARKMTISTVGLVPMIERLSKEGLQIELSVSLHAPNDTLRGRLMPVNTKYPLTQLIPACRAYTAATKRHITFEYIVIDHVNDGEREARELAVLLKGLPCKVNLIPCHPTPGTMWARPPIARMLAFERALQRGGISCMLRRSRGLDIDGACGQLRLRHLDALPQPVK